MLERLISTLPKLVDLTEVSGTGKPKVNEFEGFEEKPVADAGNVNGQKVNFLVKKHQEKNKDMSYDAAYTIVGDAHPELIVAESK